jgi:Protein of unknown function (DUF3568)
MKALLFLIALFGAALLLLSSAGCSTTEPGATDTLGNYSTNVNSTPDKVANAANKACQDLKFVDVNSTVTKVDGKVTAKTAQGDDVNIEIAQAGQDVSSVTVRVGATGDPAISKEIVDRIKNNLSSWF